MPVGFGSRRSQVAVCFFVNLGEHLPPALVVVEELLYILADEVSADEYCYGGDDSNIANQHQNEQDSLLRCRDSAQIDGIETTICHCTGA